MRSIYNKVPLTIRITPIQKAALDSRRYAGLVSVIMRFFINKLINGELPAALALELEKHIMEQSQERAAA